MFATRPRIILVWRRWSACVAALVPLHLSACSPIVAGPGYFGIGGYRARDAAPAPGVAEADVRGIGILVIGGHALLGYADVALLSTAPGVRDVRATVGGSEIFVGEEADQEAQRMSRHATATDEGSDL